MTQMNHANFRDFMVNTVLPAKVQNPNHTRLDGDRARGNRDSFGKFFHQGKLWNVHADTHFEPLELALRSFESGTDPFMHEPTKKGLCLVLIPILRDQQSTRFKHLYIYEIEQ